jgi:hypothetical protein
LGATCKEGLFEWTLDSYEDNGWTRLGGGYFQQYGGFASKLSLVCVRKSEKAGDGSGGRNR